MSSTQAARAYRPRQAQQTVVHQVVKEYLPELIEQAELGSYSLPAFVQGELEAFLACGDLSEGFTHLKCSRCGHDRFLPFSCKTRSIC
ncbi:MAG: transposase zinc-binding domain-containing protein, partial [Myxococcota bacterium]